MLAIPFRQQLPSVVAKSLDTLVPNIKKDILGSLSTRNLSDVSGWIDIPFVIGNFTTPTVGATWTLDIGSIVNHRYKVEGRTMTMMLSTFTMAMTGNPTTLTLRVPGSYQIEARGYSATYQGFAGGAGIQNTVGPPVPRGIPLYAVSNFAATQGRTFNITPMDFGHFGGPGNSIVALNCLFVFPLLEWRT